ncbi:hypothetical protein [Streptomyces venezuelae]|uniref:Uncharacterized protein n=1 Tax=Streptomyces venezuelae TaxID=54571 RepID=A0A5P2BPN6_STRVZ|nr:hypothetical protein [Streptomyces venezuelae]QES31041.1 hypothetical protein DEJ47_35615 [Streptomyces venezuelae]
MATVAELDLAKDERERRIRDGEAAEMRHLLHDADADSVVPAFVCLRKGVRKGVRRGLRRGWRS